VAIGQLALRGREYVVSLKPCGRGIVLETLRYADEVYKAQGYFRDIADAKPDEELLDLAETLIDKKAAPFDPGKFHDRYIDALKELIERKRKGHTISTEDDDKAPQRGMNVVDLMAALKRSIEKPGAANDEDAAKRKPAAAKKAQAKKAVATPPPRKAAAKAPAKRRASAR
jgi:DNA end-binding protein Ku